MNLCQRGLIPGPDESEENFLKRVKAAKTQKYYDDSAELALLRCKELFGVEPDWVPLFFSNKNLSPWEGAACWIDDNCQPLIQMRYIFQRKQKFLGIYDKVELLSHEFLHAARSGFEEPHYEEFLAYKTGNKFRAFFGSFIRTPKEVYVFIAALSLGLGGMFYDDEYLALLPVTLLIFAFVRTLFIYRTWSRCKKKLSDAFLFRLSDKEIKKFSKMSKEEIHSYIEEAKKISYRWQIIAEPQQLT